jgi:hypothetical protein
MSIIAVTLWWNRGGAMVITGIIPGRLLSIRSEGDDCSSCMFIRLFVALLHCLVEVHDTPEKYELNPGALMIGDRARARLSFASRWGNGRAVSWTHRVCASSSGSELRAEEGEKE